MILLTDEEAGDVYEKTRIELNAACCGCLDDYAGAVAKAQLKKMVEWMREHNSAQQFGLEEVPLMLRLDAWEALLKEIE